MGESAVRSSTISATSAEKRHVSKNAAKADPVLRSRRSDGGSSPFFSELARLSEMSLVERRLRSFGFRAIAGTDEVGRGCLAGPVVAAAVILPADFFLGLNDSKLLGADQRLALSHLILAHAAAVGIGVVDPHVIDRINILQASKLAMTLAVEELAIRPEVLLLDAVIVERLDLPQVPLIEGDRRSASIAAASIVAKVYRDKLMESYHEIYPHYDFNSNRGYGTEGHWRGLERFGPTPIHRRSFEGVTGTKLLFD